MLIDILNEYSVGELGSFVGNEVILQYEKLIDKPISKSELVDAVFGLYGLEIIYREEHRKILIDRMSAEQLDSIISDFIHGYEDDIELGENLDKYQLVESLARCRPEKFVEVFGFKGALDLVKESSSMVSGISIVESAYPMYPYQQRMVKKVNELISSGVESRCLLHLPTGAGKTRTAINIASEHLRNNDKGLVLWLADKSELCSQACSEFEKAWTSVGNRDVKLYSYYSDSNISLGGIDSGFLVAGLQKLHSVRGSDEYRILYEKLRRHVSLIIFDEAHKSIAPTYEKSILDMINPENETFLLGLSATPGRKLEQNSDEDEKLSLFFNNCKVTMNIPGYESPIKYLVEKKYLAKANFYNIEYEGNKILLADKFSNKKPSNEIIRVLSEDDSRNLKLIEVVKKEWSSGKSIIVFACSVEHSRMLSTMLAFNGVKSYSLDSKYDTDETRRFKISDYSKGNVKVLINYDILTAGFDAPITSVAIIARPTDSLVKYSQMAGRAMRGKLSGGNDECSIYTVRDDIPAFTSVAQAFTYWDKLWNEV